MQDLHFFEILQALRPIVKVFFRRCACLKAIHGRLRKQTLETEPETEGGMSRTYPKVGGRLSMGSDLRCVSW